MQQSNIEIKYSVSDEKGEKMIYERRKLRQACFIFHTQFLSDYMSSLPNFFQFFLRDLCQKCLYVFQSYYYMLQTDQLYLSVDMVRNYSSINHIKYLLDQ